MSQEGLTVDRDLCKGCPDNNGKDGKLVQCNCALALVERVKLSLPRSEGNNRNRCPHRRKAAKKVALQSVARASKAD